MYNFHTQLTQDIFHFLVKWKAFSEKKSMHENIHFE